MDEDPKANPPIVRGRTAVKDISAVVDFILARRNIPRLSLLGFPWGSTTGSPRLFSGGGRGCRLAERLPSVMMPGAMGGLQFPLSCMWFAMPLIS